MKDEGKATIHVLMQIKISIAFMSKYLLLQDFEIRLCIAENFAFIIYKSKFLSTSTRL